MLIIYSNFQNVKLYLFQWARAARKGVQGRINGRLLWWDLKFTCSKWWVVITCAVHIYMVYAALHFTFFSSLLKCFILEIVPCQYLEICLILFKSCMVSYYMDVLYILGSVDGHLGSTQRHLFIYTIVHMYDYIRSLLNWRGNY